MSTTPAPRRWRWRDLPIRKKGVVVIAAAIVPQLVATVLVTLALGLAGPQKARHIALTATYAGTAFGVCGGLVAALLFTRGIADRFSGIARDAERLSRGEAPVADDDGDDDDELGRTRRRLHDVAAELRARQQAVDARTAQVTEINRELESFSYSVSHDLRAPVRHVVGFSALLRQRADPALDATSRRYLDTIVDAATRMGRLIDDLLSFSRMSKAEMALIEVDLNALVADVLVEQGNGSSGGDVAWTLHPMPRVRGDRAMLRIALTNLVSNALKYTAPRARREIEIGARPEPDGSVTVFVKDNGVGFDMAYAGKLFGVFQRLHSAEEFEGTGIGLANVRRIVQRHGGRTWAEGRPDAGATFYVSLPPREEVRA
jgi:signal transduction histidine kinase